jgi:chitodextrinase
MPIRTVASRHRRYNRYRVRAVDVDRNFSGYSNTVTATTASAFLSVIRVNAGGPAYTDSLGRPWSADTGFNTGFTASSPTIGGTPDPVLFNSLRWDAGSPPELEYSFSVSPGTYQVKLYFAETFGPAFAVGARVFDIQLEGVTVFQNFDIFAEAGANTALVKTATTQVADGQLNILFLHGPAENPFVNAIEISQSATDGRAPSVPAGLSVTATSPTQTDLQWSVSSDNVAVTGYRVERCRNAGCSDFTEIGTTSGTTFSDAALVPAKTYRYRVRAIDAAGNLSGYSTAASVAMPTLQDTQAPSAPTGLIAIVDSSAQVRLSWTASADNIRVMGYRIERCAGASCSSFVQVGASVGPTFNDLGVSGSTTYRYRVRAADATPNLSAYSSIVNATTPSASDTQPPTTPSGLSATPVSGTRIDLTWTASTDNVGIAGYLVERCEGAACTDFSQIGIAASSSYSDTGLSPSATYRYRVRAIDSQNNASAYSSIVAGTTLALSDTAGSVTYEYDSFGRLKRVTVVPQ